MTTKRTGLVAFIVVAAAVGALSGSALSQDKGAPAGMEAQMEAYMNAVQPGKAHKALEPLIGVWTTATTMWMEPGGAPMQTTGEVVKSWSLDGRFVHEEVTMQSPMGQPSKGIGYLGYDNGQKQYQGVWMSDMATAMICYSGTADAAGKTFTFTGKESNPMGGGTLDFRSELTIEGPVKHTLALTYLMPGEAEHKAFEIVHTRRK